MIDRGVGHCRQGCAALRSKPAGTGRLGAGASQAAKHRLELQAMFITRDSGSYLRLAMAALLGHVLSIQQDSLSLNTVDR